MLASGPAGPAAAGEPPPSERVPPSPGGLRTVPPLTAVVTEDRLITGW